MQSTEIIKTSLQKSHNWVRKVPLYRGKTNTKAFFKYASSKLNYSQTSPDLKDGNKTTSDNCEKAKTFNILFASVFAKETYGIRLSHIFEIPNISNKKLSISTKIPSISIENLGFRSKY